MKTVKTEKCKKKFIPPKRANVKTKNVNTVKMQKNMNMVLKKIIKNVKTVKTQKIKNGQNAKILNLPKRKKNFIGQNAKEI